MPFQKGHKLSGGKGSNGQLRRDLTISLASNLTQIEKEMKDGKSVDRARLDIVIDQRIWKCINKHLRCQRALDIEISPHAEVVTVAEHESNPPLPEEAKRGGFARSSHQTPVAG